MDSPKPVATEMPPKLSGACLCGRSRYMASSTGALSTVCHCKSCQRQTGSAFSLLVGVPSDVLSINREDLSEVTTRGDSGLPVHRWFCRHCGSPMYSAAEASPQYVWIKAGTLDDTAWIQPVMHLWAADKQPWVPSGGPAAWVDGNPPQN